jgi:AraC-like DNA-binding protein
MTLASTPEIHPPERSHVEISDPAELHGFLESAYGAKLRLSVKGMSPRDGSPVFAHARIDVGPFAIDEVQLPGDLAASQHRPDKVVGVSVTAGRLEGECEGMTGGAGAGQVTMVGQSDLPNQTCSQDLHHTVLLMDPSVVAGVATGTPSSQATLPIRFTSFAPVDLAAGELWRNAVRYVKEVVLCDDALATTLVLGQASRLLAAVTLSTFPNMATAEPTPHDRNDHHPVLLRRAIEFIEANIIRDIGIVDIADAVHVTPRAVHYLFRRHLDTTPLQYLRRLRLQYAHEELRGADRMDDTVATIAARWGFVNTGRFVLLYRETYGQSPHTTLRLNSDTSPGTWAHSSELRALLLRTLWAYREFGGDPSRTAEALGVHHSTVRYRLHRIRELTGRDPGDPGSLGALRDILRPNTRD